MVGRCPEVVSVYLDAKLGPFFPIECVDELGHEPRGMIIGYQFAESRWQ